jgi:diguanylate cyclase (GGDEF)-like protein
MALAANQDALTGIANRRAIGGFLQAAITEAALQGQPGAILMIDLDHFKQINDTYGHNVGDLALQMVANTLNNNLRAGDSVGRWGGEEFLVVLRQISPSRLGMVANKLRTLLAASAVPLESGAVGLTGSIGATLLLPNDTPQEAVARADQLLYVSKAGGRNCVTLG